MQRKEGKAKRGERGELTLTPHHLRLPGACFTGLPHPCLVDLSPSSSAHTSLAQANIQGLNSAVIDTRP